jgi:hypothetical protein
MAKAKSTPEQVFAFVAEEQGRTSFPGPQLVQNRQGTQRGIDSRRRQGTTQLALDGLHGPGG